MVPGVGISNTFIHSTHQLLVGHSHVPDIVLGEQNRQIPYSNRAYHLGGREMGETKCIHRTGAIRKQGNKGGRAGKSSLGKWHLSRYPGEMTGEPC